MSFLTQLLNYPNAVLAWITANIFFLKSISVVISAIFIWGIIYCIVKSKYIDLYIERWMDILNLKTLPKRRASKIWQQIQRRLKTEKPNNWKLAILQSDRIFDEILKLSGAFGESMEERLQNVVPNQIPHLDEVIKAHKIARQIMQDPDFPIDLTLAKETVKIYEKLFQEYDIVD